MGAFVVVLVLSVLVAGFVIGVAAYPSQRHRVQAAPAPAPVKDAVDKVGGSVTRILDEVSAGR
jgi:hypothetical protein